jgi:hypothetical protein
MEKTSLKSLQEECRKLGLRVYGTKATLQMRINEKLEEPEEPQEPEEPEKLVDV